MSVEVQFAKVTLNLADLIDFWPDASKPMRRWSCRLCCKHRPPREPSVDAIFMAAREHVTDKHHAVVTPLVKRVKA